MTTASRRSLLQTRILLRLAQGPVRTISDLAKAVEAQRPSVSRSLKKLRNDQLVVRKRNGWNLTPTGEDEAKRCNQELSLAVDNMRRTYRAAIPTELMKTMDIVSNSPLNRIRTSNLNSSAFVQFTDANRSLSKMLAETAMPFADTSRGISKMLAESAMPFADTSRGISKMLAESAMPFADTSRGISKMLAESAMPFADTSRGISKMLAESAMPFADTSRGISKMLAESVLPFADISRSLSEMLAPSMAVPDLGLVISRNNAMIASAIEDIQAVYTAPEVRQQGFDRVFYPGVLRDMRDIGVSFRTLFSESLRVADVTKDLAETQQTWSRMLLPSSTVANFTLSLRSRTELSPSTSPATLSPRSGRGSPQESLDELLTELNPDLVDRRQGSWLVLGDTNPDRLSQAAFSYRELIRMTLDELAPDIRVDPSEQGSKRKRQVRQVLSGREGDFAIALVEGLSKLYDFLNKSAHTSYRNEVAVQAALMAGDGLLLMLLSSRGNPHS